MNAVIILALCAVAVFAPPPPNGRGPPGQGPQGRGPQGRGPQGRGPQGHGPHGGCPFGNQTACDLMEACLTAAGYTKPSGPPGTPPSVPQGTPPPNGNGTSGQPPQPPTQDPAFEAALQSCATQNGITLPAKPSGQPPQNA